MIPTIHTLTAREILDSRGDPTLEVEIQLSNARRYRASVPSGASTGSKEAVPLRDRDPKRYHGKGVLQAIRLIEAEIQDVLQGFPLDPVAIDSRLCALDGTVDKHRLGANTILGVSLAAYQAAADTESLTLAAYLSRALVGRTPCLPVPLMNVINGGCHADNALEIQEFMVVPLGAPSFQEAVRYGAEIYAALRAILKSQGLVTAVGDEGGFAPDLPSTEDALDILLQAIAHAGFTPGKDVYLALDVAASELYEGERYRLASEQRLLTSEQFALYLKRLVENYPILSIEDGMHETDWEGWIALTQMLGNRVQLVGDDVFVTHPDLLREGISRRAANAILIKPNQIGTLTETLSVMQIACAADMGVVVSHRSGETEDTSVADLAVACGAGQIKVGAPCRTDRVAKYNQLLRLAEHGYPFAGASAYARYLCR